MLTLLPMGCVMTVADGMCLRFCRWDVFTLLLMGCVHTAVDGVCSHCC